MDCPLKKEPGLADRVDVIVPSAPQRIHIVDDNADDIALLRRILVGAGYLVSDSNSGRPGLRAIQEGAFDLVILDLGMPEMDGFEILGKLRNQIPRPKIIVVSGFLEGRMLSAAKRLGAEIVLDKVIALDLIVASVRKVLDKAN